MASRLKEMKLLEQDTRVTFYCNREKDFLEYFGSDSGLVYFHDIRGLLCPMGAIIYDPNGWRLSVDS